MENFPLYPNWLQESYSLEGEDRLVLSLLRGIINKFEGAIFYLDVGCNDPLKYNNTYLFYQLGYRGICIDPLPESEEKFKRLRSNDFFIKAAITDKNEEKIIQIYESDDASTLDPKTQKRYSAKFKEKKKLKVKTKTLQTIFNELNLKDNLQIPLLSIDVEGYDEIVFKQALEMKHNFEVVIIEDKLINLNKPFPQTPIGKLAKDNDYVMIGKTPLNSIYIKSDSKIFGWIPESMIKK